MQGTVKCFDSKKGYGFINGSDGKEYFFHYSQLLMDGFKSIDAKQQIEFDAVKTDRGIQANKVKVI